MGGAVSGASVGASLGASVVPADGRGAAVGASAGLVDRLTLFELFLRVGGFRSVERHHNISRRRDMLLPRRGRGVAAKFVSPWKIHVAAAAAPRLVPAEYPRRGVSATRIRGLPTSRPRRRRDSSLDTCLDYIYDARY